MDSIPLRLQDLLTLRPGDMIDTQISQGSEVQVLLDGHKLFRAVAASQEGRRVVKITRVETEPT
jgi:flagellar motor switch protein FliM